jgi:hypothetical protein
MPKVTGVFEITLRTPICISFDINKVPDLHLEVDGNNVLLHPLEPRPPVEVKDEGGEIIDIEPPALEKISIWITIDFQGLHGVTPKRLPVKERKRFEPIIIETTRRFVKAIVAKTENWQLDYHQPVDCYTSKYFLQGEKLSAEFLEESTRLIPEGCVEGRIVLRRDELIGELTEDIWKEVEADIQEPVELNYYDEAIFDAMRFRRQLRYATAVLYSAFAAETILKEISIVLLGRRSLTTEQIDIFLDHVKTPSLVKLIETFLGSVLPKFGEHKLEKLFKTRNDIAHKKKTSATSSEASSAIRVALELKKLLHNLK